MIKNYIKVAIRYFVKDRIFASINIVGFILSITFALLLMIWIMDELSYEKSFSDSERTFRVVEIAKINDEIVKKPTTYIPLAEALKNNFPFIEDATFIKYESVYALQQGENKLECKTGFIDSSFFKIFDYDFIEGSAESLFAQREGIVITKTTSKKLFGDETALGKELIHNYYSDVFTYIVAGVIDDQINTHQGFDILFSIENTYHKMIGKTFGSNWRRGESTTTYAKFKSGYIISEKDKLRMADFLKNFKNTTSRLWFQAINDIHLHQDFENPLDQNRGDYKIVILYSLLAILLLIISVFNFINLNMARITNRYKEIAVRKIQGASRWSVAIQFFLEMLFQSVVAVYIGSIFAEIVRPIFNNIIGKELYIPYSLEFFVYLLILGILLGLLAGIYPAVFLSRLSPMSIFAQKNPKSANHFLVRALTILQFSASAGMLIIGTIISQQLAYINHKDLGIEKENILTLETGLWYDAESFQQEIRNNPKVLGATAVTNNPVDFFFKNRGVKIEGIPDKIEMTEVFADAGFLDTYKPQIIQGEFLYSEFNRFWERDTAAMSIPTVINESAKKIIGKDDPIGLRINNDYVIIGVVADFHFHSLHDQIKPMMMSYNPEAIFEVDIRIAPENKAETIEYLKNTYFKYRPERTFDYHFFDDLLDKKYQNETRLSQIIFAFVIFCMIISILGVIGLSVLETIKKTKEIAIRKVHGANVNEIIILIGKKYIVNLLIAFLIGGFTATYYMRDWLQNFAYRTEINLVSYALPIVILSISTLITVYLIVARASLANPVKSLRYE